MYSLAKNEINALRAGFVALFALLAVATLVMFPVQATEANFLITSEIAPSFSAEIIPAGGAVVIPTMNVGENEKTSGICTFNINSNAPWSITAVDYEQPPGVTDSYGRFKYMTSGSVANGNKLASPLQIKVTNGSYVPLSTTANTPVTLTTGAQGTYSGLTSFKQVVSPNDPATGTNYLWMKVSFVAHAT